MSEYINALITDMNTLTGVVIEFPNHPAFTETENIEVTLEESFPMIHYTHVQIIEGVIHPFTAVDKVLDHPELKILGSFKTIEEYEAFTQGVQLGLSIEMSKIHVSRSVLRIVQD